MFKSIIVSLLLTVLFTSCSMEKTIYKDNRHYCLTREDADWVLSFPSAGYSIENQAHNAKSSTFIFNDEQKKYIVVCEIDKNDECHDASSCRENFINNPVGTPFLKLAGKLTKFDIGQAAVVEYFVGKYEGQDIHQNNITAVFYKKGFSIKIHISKPNYQESERGKMIKFIESISFVGKQK
jgi:hypothetical protein